MKKIIDSQALSSYVHLNNRTFAVHYVIKSCRVTIYRLSNSVIYSGVLYSSTAL